MPLKINKNVLLEPYDIIYIESPVPFIDHLGISLNKILKLEKSIINFNIELVLMSTWLSIYVQQPISKPKVVDFKKCYQVIWVSLLLMGLYHYD